MVVIFTIHAVYEMEAQLKLHRLGQLAEQGVLTFRRKFGKYQVTFRLPGTPDLFEGARVEGRKGHEIYRHQFTFVIIEVALAVRIGWHLLAFLQHLTGTRAGN